MKEAILYEMRSNGEAFCKLCAHYCSIKDGKFGICKTRFNKNGRLLALNWGKADGAAIDPIEKKPLFHYKPGAEVLSFGPAGCNFHCMHCQNSHLSYNYKYNPDSDLEEKLLAPGMIADMAESSNAGGIAYTYSEPAVFLEYARDTVKECRRRKKAKQLFHVFISNGFFSKEAIELIYSEDLFQAINIDLKFFNHKKYKEITGGRLSPTLESIERCFELRDRIHIEIINLIIPGENDSEKEIRGLCKYLAGISRNIPLHFNRFYPRHRFSDKQPTPVKTLEMAKQIAQSEGIRYIYIGNVALKGAQDTCCPSCGELLIKRGQYKNEVHNAFGNEKTKNPPCPSCGEIINIIL